VHQSLRRCRAGGFLLRALSFLLFEIENRFQEGFTIRAERIVVNILTPAKFL
jgi:hypothetical protein